ncbi:MAG: ABC transporter ATP-binding protein/permease, partial [Paracoccaceae bacterium]|nr:ABC transporter ATP-binding protein/permease [Paracoccaceae bacterium]
HSVSQIRFLGSMLDSVCADLAETSERAVEQSAQRYFDPPTDRIELTEVDYQYPGAGSNSLNRLSLAIKAKTTVGIVGGTGAGKTTAIDVILGLLRPDSGGLYVDGKLVEECDIRGWQKSVGYVPQQIFLTDDTIAANIAFGIPEAERDAAKIKHAAKLANLHDFVEKELPDGYQTRVGERGVRLSGGQRQRIGIARALYSDPAVLIFDEATSALDNITERAVMDAVGNLTHEKTIIMIAHRLSTVRNCDQIFLLDKGGLSASGTYEELRQNSEIFRHMAEADGEGPV